jgi:hypothetical protein
MVAECEADLIWLRTEKGCRSPKPRAGCEAKLPKLKPNQAKHLLELHDLGTVAGTWQRAGEPVQRHTKVSPARQAASASRRPGRPGSCRQAVVNVDAVAADPERVQPVALGGEILLLC